MITVTDETFSTSQVVVVEPSAAIGAPSFVGLQQFNAPLENSNFATPVSAIPAKFESSSIDDKYYKKFLDLLEEEINCESERIEQALKNENENGDNCNYVNDDDDKYEDKNNYNNGGTNKTMAKADGAVAKIAFNNHNEVIAKSIVGPKKSTSKMIAGNDQPKKFATAAATPSTHNGVSLTRSRFHRCECVKCLPPGGGVRRTGAYVTTRLPHSGIKLDILGGGGRDALHLTALPHLELFVASSSAVAIVFYQIRVQVRNNGHHHYYPHQPNNYNTRYLQSNHANSNHLHHHRQHHHHAHRFSTRATVVEIINKHYSAVLRAGSVRFTSAANLLTYSIDKSGCKTKICTRNGAHSLYEKDFVNEQWHNELLNAESSNGQKNNNYGLFSHPKIADSNGEVNVKKTHAAAGQCYLFEDEIHRTALSGDESQKEQSQTWTIEEFQITERSNGNLYVQNRNAQLHLSIYNKQQSLCLQLPNLCVTLHKSGHFFVTHKLVADKVNFSPMISNSPVLVKQPLQQNSQAAAHALNNSMIFSSNEIAFACEEDIELLSQVSFGGGGGGGAAPIHNNMYKNGKIVSKNLKQNNRCNDGVGSDLLPQGGDQHYNKTISNNDHNDKCNVSDHNNYIEMGEQSQQFNLNRVMSNSEQFAICGISGLLVKHHNRRAGLNQKSQICLL